MICPALTVIATGFELKAQKPVFERAAEDRPSINPADFFAGFNRDNSAPKANDMLPSFTNIEIPDFLKK